MMREFEGRGPWPVRLRTGDNGKWLLSLICEELADQAEEIRPGVRSSRASKLRSRKKMWQGDVFRIDYEDDTEGLMTRKES